MPDIKITYFDLPGRAELPRLTLKLGNIPFTDERLPFTDWPSLRDATPYKALPTLTVDGAVYAQSYAIARYCGRLAGLYPSDDEPARALLVDEVIETFNDIQSALRTSTRDDAEAKKYRDLFFQPGGGADIYFGGLDRRLLAVGAGPFVLGESMSIADIGIYCGRLFYKSGMLAHFPADSLDQYTKLNEIADNVAKHPVVEAWQKEHS